MFFTLPLKLWTAALLVFLLLVWQSQPKPLSIRVIGDERNILNSRDHTPSSSSDALLRRDAQYPPRALSYEDDISKAVALLERGDADLLQKRVGEKKVNPAKKFWNKVKKGFKKSDGGTTSGDEGDSDSLEGVNFNPIVSGAESAAAAARERADAATDPSALRRLWDSVDDTKKVKAGKQPIAFQFDTQTADKMSTVEFYGCTVAVVWNGKDGFIGHFCEEVENRPDQQGGTVLSDEILTDEWVIKPLDDALQKMGDINDHTRAWLVYASAYDDNAQGVVEMKKSLTSAGVPATNIDTKRYAGQGTSIGTRRGGSGKLVIEWTPNGNAGNGNSRARFKLWIEDENTRFDQNYDCNGDEA